MIPTVLRDTVRAAIASARAQQGAGAVEVIVVVDRDSSQVDEAALSLVHDADQVIFTGGSRGAAAARNQGVLAARGDFVAFLDDDDEWLPGKLSVQVAAAAALPQDARRAGVIIGSRVKLRAPGAHPSGKSVPVDLIGPEQSPEDYLFLRRLASAGRADFYTPTILVTREVASAVPWDESLRRHQDWDWLVRACRHGALLHQVPDSLVLVTVGSRGSISASADWEASLRWAESQFPDWGRRTFVDFVAAQPLRYALQARSVRGVSACLRAVIRGRRLPSLSTLLIAAAGLLPRSVLERAMVHGGRMR